MRWDSQRADRGQLALPGLVRTVRTPEFADIVFHEVHAKSVLNKVPGSSPMPFKWTINPYRGCSHACTYCMAGHTNLSRMAKVEPEAITAVREGRPIADPKLEALRQFAAKVTRNRGVVSEADVSAFKAAGYDNRAMLDVLVLAATKLISNYTNHLAQTLLDAFMKGAEWSAPGKLKPAA